MKLQNETILITGANRGIGLGLSMEYLSLGKNVIATCREPYQAIELNHLLAKYPTQLILEQLDVTNKEELAAISGKYANSTVDILINNAGVFPEKHARLGLMDTPAEYLLDAYAINTVGAFNTIKTFLPNLLLSGNPRTINMSSQMGALSAAKGFGYSYRMSKAALNMLTKCFADENGDIITISLRPGWVKTRMGGTNADLSLEEVIPKIAALIDSLTTEDSGSFIDYLRNKNEW